MRCRRNDFATAAVVRFQPVRSPRLPVDALEPATYRPLNMEDKLKIQPPVCRADSLRVRLANLAWQEGLSAFLTNGVPFSFSSGRVLADGVAHLVDALAQNSDHVRVMEMGAGIGYLSAFCLDTLSEEFPDTYRKSEFLVTDGAPALVRDSESLGILKRHGSHARYAVSDLRDKASILQDQPRLLILSYLIDAIPPDHIIHLDNETASIRVATSVPRDVVVYDCADWPPKVLDAEAVLERLTGGFELLTPELARKIVPLLVEAWTWDNERDSRDDDNLLNSRRSAITDLCDVLGEMPDESAVVITDFGYVKSGEIGFSEMMSEYGLCAFWAVAFDEIQEIAGEAGYETFLLAAGEGETRTLCIYKGQNEDGMDEAFRAGFDGMVSDRPHFVLYNLEEDASIEDVHEAIDRIEREMSEPEVNAYGNLARFIHLLLRFGDTERAATYARRCVELYPEVAASELTILGSTAGRNGELAAAEVLFNQAIRVAPGLGDAYLGLSGVYRARRDWARYLESVKAYLRVADCDVPEVVAGIAQTLAGTDLETVAEEARAWCERHGTGS